MQMYDTFQSSPQKLHKDPGICKNNEKILGDTTYVRLYSDVEKSNVMMMNKCG